MSKIPAATIDDGRIAPESVAVRNVTKCPGFPPVSIEVKRSNDGISVVDLSGAGRLANSADKGVINALLRPLVSLDAIYVSCGDGGVAFISIQGIRLNNGLPQKAMVTFQWDSKGPTALP